MDKLTHLTFTLLLAAAAMAQTLPLSPALERAIAADELEHDLARAKELLRAVAEDTAAPEAVRRHAWLRVARLQRRTGEDASEALAKAAVGDDAVAVAARELAAQGQGDPEREAELQKKAEAAVEKAMQTGDFTDAIWFGAAAVPAAIRAFEGRPGHAPTPRSAALLWSLPGEGAARFLADALAADAVRRRRHLTAGLQEVGSILPRDRLDLVRRAFRDADAEVVSGALHVGWMTSYADLLPLALDARDSVRLPALHALRRWVTERLQGADREQRAVSEAIAGALPRLLATTSPEEHRLAVQLATWTAMFSAAGRTSLVAQLTAIRGGQGLALQKPRAGIDDWTGPTENADALVAAMVKLGPFEAPRSTTAQSLASQLVSLYLESCWNRQAMPAGLTAARLGYGHLGWGWLSKHAKDEDAGTVVADLAGTAALRAAAQWLSLRDLPPAAFGPLRDALSSAPDWQDDRALVLAIGRTGHRDAAALVRGLSDLRADYAAIALQALSWLASKRADAETIAALRAQVAASLPITDASERNDLAAAVGTLVRLGDPEIVNMFDALAGAFSYLRTEGGLVRGEQAKVDTSSLPAGDAIRNPMTIASPLAWLIIGRGAKVPGMWHGYSPEQYRSIWRRVLAPTDGKHGKGWAYAGRALAPLPEAAGADPLLVEVVIEAAQARIGEVEATTVAGALAVLFEALEQGTVPESLRARVRDLREAAFVAPNGDVRESAMGSLAAPFDAPDRAHLLRGLADMNYRVNAAARRPFENNLFPLDREVLEQVFKAPDASSRQSAIPLLRRIRDDVPEVLRGLLADSEEEVRLAACVELALSLRLDAVPSLLEALKDQAPRVREAATQALQSIRFYHDEKAYWDRVFDGRAGLTATSAAAALLEQAKPAHDEATRILAIRSLGVLAAPETQPFLIEWTKDSNAEVAAAAREAVGRIHASKGH